MEIIVCVKRVPLTQEVDLEINPQKTDVRKDMLAYSINEWDNYAIEEAVQLREKLGGNVTAVTVGNEEDEEVLRRCLAMGADKAIRVDPGNLLLDSVGVSKTLAQVIKGMPHDLVLSGVQADDLNEGSVGTLLAEMLGLAHALYLSPTRMLRQGLLHCIVIPGIDDHRQAVQRGEEFLQRSWFRLIHEGTVHLCGQRFAVLEILDVLRRRGQVVAYLVRYGSAFGQFDDQIEVIGRMRRGAAFPDARTEIGDDLAGFQPGNYLFDCVRHDISFV